ncbi:ABC transporter permease [Acinetobacter larvae]|uniref:ABC transmembrane type-2 domain-containing protein n=1 Tax=Acinetobacter larvae TaxID=1789224 RepID=A0A1B2M323_9GAMM|nr:ABC transporter permease [Acinetobacter larvae]AOA59600.1 hypothetical protein BFG52_15430 [Acinetobacter larvae]
MFIHKLQNIFRLGCKELWSLWRDPIMLLLITYTFTMSIYTGASSMPESLNNAPIGIVDEDHSALSERVSSAFYPPLFTPFETQLDQMDAGMDAGLYSFSMTIPSRFQEDILANRGATVQVNVDATRVTQALTGSSYIQQIILTEVNSYLQGHRSVTSLPVDLELRARFNPTLDRQWFGGIMQVINNVTMLSIILTGAALIREREHGTVEHLLVMPVTVFEIMMAKVWSMGLVVLVASFVAVHLVVKGFMHIPIEGNLWLFFLGASLSLFATTSLGIYMATVAKSMPQFGLLMMLVLIPLQMLSGGLTPRESMPEVVQNIMQFAPTTHFVNLAQAILYRNAGFDVVWMPFLCLFAIGAVFFYFALKRFKETIHTMT